MSVNIGSLWHKDVGGKCNPQELMGKKFVHVKTSALYVVVGYHLNASTDQWCIEYERQEVKCRKDFNFTRDMSEFLDGRFLEVK